MANTSLDARADARAPHWFAAVVAALFMLFVLANTTAVAAEPSAALSDQDKTCLACHSQPGFSKNLGKGQSLSLHVKGDEFALSVHGALGCAACHSEVSLESHPAAPRKIRSAREYSISRAQACQTCHEDKYKLYEGSVHAALLRGGNRAAPVCTDCHSPHSVRPKAVTEAITGVSCKKCHEPIFNAYSESMHGQARGKLGHVEAPICADCHRAHDVTAASVGPRLRDACLGCHTGAADSHRAWLPNAPRHLEAVACPACHAPAAQRRVDLRFYDRATGKRISEREGAAGLGQRTLSASNSNGELDAVALWNLLREFNGDRVEGGTLLQGRLEVRTGVEAHRMSDKTQAIRDCDSCHSDGADPFQAVTVSVVGPDGRPIRFGADKSVLNSPMSVGSVGGFYAIGGTRIKLLDVLLVLALLGALSVPIGHQAVRWFVRRRDKTAAARRTAGETKAGDGR
jgi:nitrate/TMAO reductase-like tetraheme cytochrome c subunit